MPKTKRTTKRTPSTPSVQKNGTHKGRPLTAREQLEEQRKKRQNPHGVRAIEVETIETLRPARSARPSAHGGKVVVVKSGTPIELKAGDEIVVVKPGDVIRVKGSVTPGIRSSSLNSASSPKRLADALNERKVSKNHKLKSNQSVKITVDQIMELYRTSPDFRKIAESGRYIYTNGSIVLYDPGSLAFDEYGIGVIPNEDAVSHPLDHCLAFLTDKKKGTISFEHPEKYTDLLQKGLITSFSFFMHDRLKSASTGGGGGGDDGNGTDFYDGGDDESNENNRRTVEWDSSANEDLERIIKEQIKAQHTSINKLADFLGISAATISRFWTDTNSRPELSNVIAVCLALHMSPPKSEQVINLTGYYLRDIPLERTYRFLINMCYTQELKDCNDLLEYAGYEPIPLTSSKV